MFLPSVGNGFASGVYRSQNILATAFSAGLQGSICHDAGSGTAIVSASPSRASPFTAAPSKLAPDSRTWSSSSTVMANPFRVPSMSVNHSLMNLTSCCCADWSTNSFASLSEVLEVVVVYLMFCVVMLSVLCLVFKHFGLMMPT